MINVVKRSITLIEMMIVMFLIAMIIGVVAYNYQGSLDEGKAFKTKASIEKIKTILTVKLADDPTLDVQREWQDTIKKSPLVQNPSSLMKDGWGEQFQVSRDNDGRVVISSRKYDEYKKRNPQTMFKDDEEER